MNPLEVAPLVVQLTLLEEQQQSMGIKKLRIAFEQMAMGSIRKLQNTSGRYRIKKDKYSCRAIIVLANEVTRIASAMPNNNNGLRSALMIREKTKLKA